MLECFFDTHAFVWILEEQLFHKILRPNGNRGPLFVLELDFCSFVVEDDIFQLF